MITFRHALAATVLTAALAPATAVHAATDVSAAISELASEAAELIAEEQQLVRLVDADAAPAERAQIEARLQMVDRQANTVMVQLERLGLEATEAMRATMGRLPAGPELSIETRRQLVPLGVVYDAAIDDLLRIAATPDAVAPPPSSSSGPAIGLLAVGALALLVLGAAALANTLRRRPATHELTQMAWSDGLTGLANRRRLDRDLETHTQASGDTAVIMVDVDHFKSVNDSFGHGLGDEVLRRISTMLANNVRYDDVVYRYGGEEFCILLPDARIDDARAVADRIVDAARGIDLPGGGNITLSVGVAAAVEGHVADAVAIADRALFNAKEQGRDRAVVASNRMLENA